MFVESVLTAAVSATAFVFDTSLSTNSLQYIFLLRFGLANAINDN